MSRTRKNYPASFKAKAALAAFREDAPVSELALKYGVHATVIHRWKKDALSGMEAIFSDKQQKSVIDHEAQIKELHAKIGQQSMKLDFLERASNRLGLGGVKK